MAEKKFTDLPTVADVDGGDLLCLSDGTLASYQITINQVFTIPAGGSRTLLSASSGSNISVGDPHINIRAQGGGRITITTGLTTDGVIVYAAGGVEVRPKTGEYLSLYAGSNSLTMSSAGPMQLSAGAVSPGITYYPVAGTPWNYFTLPLDMALALDALCKALATLQGSNVNYP